MVLKIKRFPRRITNLKSSFLFSFTLFSFRNIQKYHTNLTDGKVTCKEVVSYYLEQIKNAESLNAFVHVFSEEALHCAERLDQLQKSGQPLGKLHGVVFSLKDVISFKGHPVSASSKMLAGYEALFSATAVERILKEGAVIIGTCNCDEFAMGSTNEHSVYGDVKNPHNALKVAGGSSGGSAAAVSAGLCMVSLGSDTGGSVRQPADFCGVTGFKPTYGAISRNGLIAYASSFDQIGIIANNIEDIGRVFEVIGGPDEYDSTALQEKIDTGSNRKDISEMKIGILSDALYHPSLDPEIKNNILYVAGELRKEGMTIEEVGFDLLDYIVPAYYVLTTAEASSNLSRYDGVRYGYRSPMEAETPELFYKQNRSEGFGREVKKRIMLGTYVLSEGFYDAYYTKAQQVRKLLVEKSEKIFNKFDVLILPTVPSTAFDIGSMAKDPIATYLADIYTVYANLAGIPAISLPLFKHTNGMPFGLQVISGAKNEVNLFTLSEHLMAHFKQY